LTYMYQLV